jgi:hypothetical protein
VFLLYFWSAMLSACVLMVAFVNGRTVVLGLLAAAVMLAAVVPRLLRGPGTHASGRKDPAVEVSTNGHGGAPGGAAAPPAVEDRV